MASPGLTSSRLMPTLSSPDGPVASRAQVVDLALLILDVQIEPRMGNEQVQFLDGPLHRRPFRDLVVAVGMVRPNRHNGDDCTHDRKTHGSDEHDPSSHHRRRPRPRARRSTRDDLLWARRAARSAPAAAPETSRLPSIRSYKETDNEWACPLRRGTTSTAGTVRVLAPLLAPCHQGCISASRACRLPRRSWIRRGSRAAAAVPPHCL